MNWCSVENSKRLSHITLRDKAVRFYSKTETRQLETPYQPMPAAQGDTSFCSVPLNAAERASYSWSLWIRSLFLSQKSAELSQTQKG